MKKKNVYIFAIYEQSSNVNQIVSLEADNALMAVKKTLVRMCGDNIEDAAFQRGVNACHNTCESLIEYMKTKQDTIISGIAEIVLPAETEVTFKYEK